MLNYTLHAIKILFWTIIDGVANSEIGGYTLFGSPHPLLSLESCFMIFWLLQYMFSRQGTKNTVQLRLPVLLVYISVYSVSVSLLALFHIYIFIHIPVMLLTNLEQGCGSLMQQCCSGSAGHYELAHLLIILVTILIRCPTSGVSQSRALGYPTTCPYLRSSGGYTRQKMSPCIFRLFHGWQ